MSIEQGQTIEEILQYTAEYAVDKKDRDEQQQMLSVVQEHLESHADDLDALLLNAELLFALHQDAQSIGCFLSQYEPQLNHSSRYRRLQLKVEQSIQESLYNGRMALKSLRDTSSSRALGHFDWAYHLSNENHSVCLASAIALIEQVLPAQILDEIHGYSLDYLLNHIKLDKLIIAHEFYDTIKQYLDTIIASPDTKTKQLHNAYHQATILWTLQLIQSPMDAYDVWMQAYQPDGKDLLSLVLAFSIQVATSMLDYEDWDKFTDFVPLIEACAPRLPAISLLHAEYHHLKNEREQEKAAYEQALADIGLWQADSVAENLIGFVDLMNSAAQYRVECKRCGHSYNPLLTHCPICDHTPPFNRLHRTTKDKDEAVDAITNDWDLAQAGLSWLSLKQHLLVEGAAYLREISNIELYEQVNQSFEDYLSDSPLSASQILGALMQIADFCRTQDNTFALKLMQNELFFDPMFWHYGEQDAMISCIQLLIESQQFTAAKELISVGMSCWDECQELSELTANIEQDFHDKVQKQFKLAQSALDAQDLSGTISACDALIQLDSEHQGALLLRARALQSSGELEQACHDFHRLSELSKDDLANETAFAAAQLYYELENYAPAYELLQNLPESPMVHELIQNVKRRIEGIPYIHIQEANSLLMTDTLTREQDFAGYYAYFAVEVASVQRYQSANAINTVISEALQFSGIIGNLYHSAGDPIFALRYIRKAEDEQIKIVLISRVTSTEADSAKGVAEELWNNMQNILPGSRIQLFQYRPVYLLDELLDLLEPFEAASITEISRLELSENDTLPYAFSPFAPGDMSLHNLLHIMLEQSSDVMLSVHLAPTTVATWESHIWQKQLENFIKLKDAADFANTSLMLNTENGLLLHPSLLNLMQDLQPSCFVMRVQIAMGENSLSLVPHRIASAFFNPHIANREAVYGGFDLISANTPEEMRIAKRNLAELDIEQWGHITAPEGLERLRYLVSQHEATMGLRLPVPDAEGLPGLSALETRPIAPPANLPKDGTVLGKTIYRHHGSPIIVQQADSDRRRHTYIVGKTGIGKTTLIQRMALQDIQRGEGVCVVDPHGDLVENILHRLPPERQNDVVLFDASDYERPIGLNLLEHHDEMQRHLIVNEFIGLLLRMYGNDYGIVGPRFQHNVRHAMLTAMEFKGATLLEVVRILTDPRYVKNLVPHIKDPVVKNYWEKQIANTSDWHKSEILDYIVSKFSRFIGDRRVRNIVGQSHSTLNLSEIMNSRKILLVNLSKGKIGAENSHFLGLLLVQMLLMSALGRASMPSDERPNFFLYVDEFQNFATDLFAVILSEGRKYGIATVCANQYLTQIPSNVRDALFGNIGTLISFRLGLMDAVNILPELQPGVDGNELLNLPQYTAFVKLLVDGTSSRAFTMQTLPEDILPDVRIARIAREKSRQLYGTDIASITSNIEERMKDVKSGAKFDISTLFK